jgi:CheY-like chemotaxis protein
MSNKRILLIEDDFDVAEMLIMYFQSRGYDIFHAEDGHVGIEKAREHFPHIILLDVMLPYMDGYEICRRLREVSLTRYIPIIFLTQRDERADRVQGLELGADDYITKPFDLEELRLRVSRSIRRAEHTSLHEARTGLPTGPLVEDELNRRAARHDLRLSLSGLSTYRDVYGFIAADEAFGFAGRCVQEVISAEGTPDDFVGVMGDQFVILTSAPQPHAIEAQIKDRFAGGVRAFYNFVDAERGGILVHDTLVPLMSLNPVQAAV